MPGVFMPDAGRPIVERMADVKLELAPYVSPTDTMAKISAPGGTVKYDLMVSLTEFVKGPVLGPGAGDEKALALDLDKIPNSKKLMPLFQDEIVTRDGKPYFIPVYWGYDSVLYNTEAIAQDMAQSWGILFDDKYAGKVALRDDAHQMIHRRGAVPRARGSQRDDGCRTQGCRRLPDLERRRTSAPCGASSARR